MASDEGALSDLRVLDLTQVLAGPYCSQILADFGAEVIKVESPSGGDQARSTLGPKLRGDDRAGFLAINRNKKSLALDLRKPAGLELFHQLVRSADVVIENFRPGVTKRLGIDYDTLRTLNRGLIYASISGFGQTGPDAGRAGYDLVAQALSGVMSVTGEEGRPPVKCGIPISDLGAGLYAVIGILMAHAHRGQTGLGQHIETSLFESALGMSVWEATQYWHTDTVPGPLGSAHRFAAPYQAFRTQDGFLAVAANNEKSWLQLCMVLNRPDWPDDPRFATNDARMSHLPDLVEEIEAVLQGRSSAEWEALLTEAGVACGEVRTYDAALEAPHTRARGVVVSTTHAVEGEVNGLATPVHLSETPGRARHAAPLLGQDTHEILGALGLDADQIATLEADQTIRVPDVVPIAG